MSAGSLLKLGMFHACVKMDAVLLQDLFYAQHHAYQCLLVYISGTLACHFPGFPQHFICSIYISPLLYIIISY